jgi:hypothetical protein
MGDFGFEFPKRSQLFIRPHTQTFSVAAMRVSHEDRSPFAISDLLWTRGIQKHSLTLRQ